MQKIIVHEPESPDSDILTFNHANKRG